MVDVIYLPFCFVGVVTRSNCCPWRIGYRRRHPSVLVHSAIGDQFEDLRFSPIRSLSIIEGVNHAHSLDGLLCYAVERIGRMDPSYFEDRRHKVGDVMELSAHTAMFFDLCRPRDDHWVARATEVGSDLLRPLEGRVHGVRPS